jgi:hypothetical protein
MVTGSPAHGGKQAFKVTALYRQQLGQRFAAPGLVVGQDHLAHGDDALAFKKHVLGTAQANARCTKAAGHAGFFRACLRWSRTSRRL